jgi:hypothetical protein
MRTMRTVFNWCIDTLGTLFGCGNASEPVIDERTGPLADYRLPDVARMKRIKALAAAMDAPDADAAAFIGVNDPVVSWLAAMDKPMRGLVGAASAIALEDHMKGRRSIRGLLAFDRASVAAWNEIGGGGDEVGGGRSGGRGRKAALRQVAAGFGKMR